MSTRALTLIAAASVVAGYENGATWAKLPILGWATWYVHDSRPAPIIVVVLISARSGDGGGGGCGTPSPRAGPSRRRCTDDLCGLLDFCNEEEIHEIADALVSSGMQALVRPP